jgi:hypothetical protein
VQKENLGSLVVTFYFATFDPPPMRTAPRSSKTDYRPRRSGAALVEFAVILPVLVLILMGTIETCTMIFLKQSLHIAAYEGARVAIVPDSEADDVRNAANRLLGMRRVKGASITVFPEDIANAPYGSFIQVEITAPCSINSVLPLPFYGGRTMRGTVEMMKEFD